MLAGVAAWRVMGNSTRQTKYQVLKRKRAHGGMAATRDAAAVDDAARRFAVEMSWSCRLVVAAFGLLYATALVWTALSLVSWLGVPAPLPGVFLIVLGLPWTLAAAMVPDQWQPLAAALAPGVSLLILFALCHRRDR